MNRLATTLREPIKTPARVRSIREAAHISQSRFANLIAANRRTFAKPGAASHAAHRTRQGAAQDRCFKPEGD